MQEVFSPPPSYDSLNMPGSHTPSTPILGLSADQANASRADADSSASRRRSGSRPDAKTLAQRAANAVSRMTNGEIREVAAIGARLKKSQSMVAKLKGEKDDLFKYLSLYIYTVCHNTSVQSVINYFLVVFNLSVS